MVLNDIKYLKYPFHDIFMLALGDLIIFIPYYILTENSGEIN